MPGREGSREGTPGVGDNLLLTQAGIRGWVQRGAEGAWLAKHLCLVKKTYTMIWRRSMFNGSV